MSKFTARKLKVVATLSSVALFATAFTPGGCTINVDQELLGQLGSLIGSFSGPDGPGGPGGPGSWRPDDCPYPEGECPGEVGDPRDGPWDDQPDQD